METPTRQVPMMLAATLVLPLCLAATVVATLSFYFAGRAKDQVRFRSAVEWARDSIDHHLREHVSLLRAGTGFFAGSDSVSSNDFRAFVHRLRLPEFYPGVQGIGFAKRAPGVPGGPGNPATEVFPIEYIEPLNERNRHAVGYDMFSEPVRREAMERAMDFGVPVASGKVTLVQEIYEKKQAGFLIYVPVYAQPDIPATVEERRQSILGFVYSPFRADDFFLGIFGLDDTPNLHYRVYDGPAPLAEKLLHTSTNLPSARPQFTAQSTLQVPGREWAIVFETTPAFEADSSKSIAWWVLGVGLSLSFIITGITASLGRAQARAETARKDAWEQRERYAVTLSSIGDAVITVNLRGQLTYMNKSAEMLTGWTWGEASKGTLSQVFRILGEDTKQPEADPVESVFKGTHPAGSRRAVVLINRSGAEIPVEHSAAPIRESGGALAGVVIMFSDVSERRAADQLRAKLAAIVQSSDDAIFSQDFESVVTSWNPGAERLFGYAAEEMIGAKVTILVPPDRLGEEERNIEAARQGMPVTHLETVRFRKDGRSIEVSLTVSPVRDANGVVTGISKIARDITSQKAAERQLRLAQQQLKSHAEDLEKAVLDRTRKLRETIAELEAFSYSLSHDMRAPLRSITSFTQLLLAEHGAHLNANGRDYAEKILAASRRMDQLIRDVLSFTRISRQEVTIAPVDTQRVIKNLLADIQDFHPPKADVRIEGDLPAVWGHEASLIQCATNLLSNAVKFVPHGVQPKVIIRAEVRGEQARIWFEDNGVGIEKACHEKVFELFHRQHSGYDGTGLGLAIVRKAVERMEGVVGVESEPGKGSRFWLQLRRA